jgi:hypothetical protein
VQALHSRQHQTQLRIFVGVIMSKQQLQTASVATMADNIAGVAKWTCIGIVAVIGLLCLVAKATTGTAIGRDPLSGGGVLPILLFVGFVTLFKAIPFLLGIKFLAWVTRKN